MVLNGPPQAPLPGPDLGPPTGSPQSTRTGRDSLRAQTRTPRSSMRIPISNDATGRAPAHYGRHLGQSQETDTRKGLQFFF
eukprot:3874109-Rhodomonas_salina.1